VSPAKTAERIDMAFGRLTRVGQRNHVLGGDTDHPTKRGNFWKLSGQFKSIGSLCCGFRCKWIIRYTGKQK